MSCRPIALVAALIAGTAFCLTFQHDLHILFESTIAGWDSICNSMVLQCWLYNILLHTLSCNDHLTVPVLCSDPAAPVSKDAKNTQELDKSATPPPQEGSKGGQDAAKGAASPPPTVTAAIEAETDKTSNQPATEALMEGMCEL